MRLITVTLLAICFIATTGALHAAPVPRGYFISVDGLQPRLLESYIEQPEANPNGFQSLWKNSAVYTQAKAHIISITAPSHAGTSTCSSPTRHGITGNHFLRNHKKVSGFKDPFQSETMWEAARRQGRKVAAFAYVAMDGTTPQRTMDLGITYPDESRMGKPAIVTVPRGDLKPIEIEILINPTKNLKLNLHFYSSGSGSTVKYVDLRGAEHLVKLPGAAEAHNPANLLIHDGERLRRIVIRLVSGKTNTYLISRPSYNEAFPESFRASLDEAGLVWPDVNIKGLDVDLGPSEVVAIQGILDDFLADVASRAIPEFKPDIVLFYQPLLDSTGHGLQNMLPDTGSLKAQDPVTVAYRTAFKRVDDNLAKVLATAGPNDVIALMGDHGMTATTTNLNVAPLLPANIEEHLDVYASDSMLYLYPKSDTIDPAAAKKLGEGVRDALAKITWQEKPVVEMAAERATIKPSDWPYGDAVWAFRSEDGIWFNNNALEKKTFLPPKVPGMHGHKPESPSMLTALMFRGPGITPAIHRSPIVSLVQAVPTFAEQLKLHTPKDCEGTSVFH